MIANEKIILYSFVYFCTFCRTNIPRIRRFRSHDSCVCRCLIILESGICPESVSKQRTNGESDNLLRSFENEEN